MASNLGRIQILVAFFSSYYWVCVYNDGVDVEISCEDADSFIISYRPRFFY